jgi:UDP-glucose 4-epimerase
LRALVTGGAGFIGSTLVDRLLAEGHTVDVLDDLSSGSLANLAAARAEGTGRLSFHQIDVRAPEVVDLMARRRPEVVFHLAARPAHLAGDDPALDASVTVLGAVQVLEGARAAGASKVVFASTAAIYGEQEGRAPAREAHPERPRSTHAVAKRTVADLLDLHRERDELEFTALVLANVYGPRQRPGAGVVASFVDALLAGRPGTVHGDGTQTRDFVYVDDVVDAFVRAAQRGSGLRCNVGTGIETSIAELHRLVAGEVGTDVVPDRAPPRPFDVSRIALDAGRAAIHLAWRPWTDLRTGIAETVAALRQTT